MFFMTALLMNIRFGSDSGLLSFRLPCARHRARSRFSCLRGEANARVWCAEAIVSTPLHNLEEKSLVKSVRVDLEKLPSAVSIVKDGVFLHQFQEIWV